MSWDVIVVGAGPAGAATAIHLARAGHAVALLDRARFPRDKACGEFLSPAATPLLEKLGVTAAIEAAGAHRIGTVRIVPTDGAALAMSFPDEPGVPAWGYAISRRALDAILVDAAVAAGAELREGTRVDDLVIDRGRVCGVVARNGDAQRRTLRSRIVVGAGGRRCIVSRRLGLQRRDPRQRIDLLGYWERRPQTPTTCELHLRNGDYVGAAAIEGDRVNVNGVVGPAWLRAEPDPRGAYLRLLRAHPRVRRWTRGPDPERVIATDVTPISTARATADGALLVGDSALFLDPFTGQGVYLALESARLAAGVMARALAESRYDAARLSEYDRLRDPAFRSKRHVSRAIQRILRHPRLARRVVLGLDRSPDLATTLAGVTGDTLPAGRALSPAFGYRLARATIAP